jgi:hypothetical protein
MSGRPATSEHLAFGHEVRQVMISLALAFMTTLLGIDPDLERSAVTAEAPRHIAGSGCILEAWTWPTP